MSSPFCALPPDIQSLMLRSEYPALSRGFATITNERRTVYAFKHEFATHAYIRKDIPKDQSLPQ
jgi:hypothetical protein